MKLHQILSPSFRSILAQLQQEPFTLYHPASMVQRSSSICSQFCQALVSCGYLSFEQMLHAAYRYRLGASAKGGHPCPESRQDRPRGFSFLKTNS